MAPPKKIKTPEQKLADWELSRKKQYERSKKYYEKIKHTPEWKEKKHKYYLERKIKLQEQKDSPQEQLVESS